jgi:hypothetical protein
MPRINFGSDSSAQKPFIVTGLNMTIDNQGVSRLAVVCQEIVDVRWNGTLERWEWYDFEAGHWRYSGGDV